MKAPHHPETRRTLYGFHRYPDGAPIALASLDPQALADLNDAGAVLLLVPTSETGATLLTVVIVAPGATPEELTAIARQVAGRPRPSALRRA